VWACVCVCVCVYTYLHTQHVYTYHAMFCYRRLLLKRNAAWATSRVYMFGLTPFPRIHRKPRLSLLLELGLLAPQATQDFPPLWRCSLSCVCSFWGLRLTDWLSPHLPFGICTILPLTILYGMYCNTGWSRGVTCCAIVCAMKKGSGVPRQRWSLQSVVLIRAHKPQHKTISCEGQAPVPLFL